MTDPGIRVGHAAAKRCPAVLLPGGHDEALCPLDICSFVMCPHTNDFYHLWAFQNFVYEAVLDIDPA